MSFFMFILKNIAPIPVTIITPLTPSLTSEYTVHALSVTYWKNRLTRGAFDRGGKTGGWGGASDRVTFGYKLFRCTDLDHVPILSCTEIDLRMYRNRLCTECVLMYRNGPLSKNMYRNCMHRKCLVPIWIFPYKPMIVLHDGLLRPVLEMCVCVFVHIAVSTGEGKGVRG